MRGPMRRLADKQWMLGLDCMSCIGFKSTARTATVAVGVQLYDSSHKHETEQCGLHVQQQYICIYVESSVNLFTHHHLLEFALLHDLRKRPSQSSAWDRRG